MQVLRLECDRAIQLEFIIPTQIIIKVGNASLALLKVDFL